MFSNIGHDLAAYRGYIASMCIYQRSTSIDIQTPILLFPTYQYLSVTTMSNLTQHPSALFSLPPDNFPSSPSEESKEYEESQLINNGSTTLIVRRIASLRLPHDHSEKELAKLVPMLEIDLEGNIINSVPDLFNTLFPDVILPFPINKNLLHSLPSTLYDPKSYQWNLDNAKTESVSKIFILEHLDHRNSL